MSTLIYLVPLLIFAGIGLYYLNIYRKGKAAGGGFMAGVQAHHQDRWKAVLQPGEVLQVWGNGVLWRPWWQYWLARQVPLLKLVWPVKGYELVITDQNRVLVGRYTAIGTFAEQKAYPKHEVRMEGVLEEKQGLAMKLNPLAPKDYKTFEGTFVLSDGPLRLCGVPSTFMEGMQA